MSLGVSAICYIERMAFYRIDQKVGGFFGEFWKFAAKGNAIQLAVAVVIGGAFGAIVNSLAQDIITPLLSLLTSDVDFSMWGYALRSESVVGDKTVPALVLGYGKLLQASLNFLVVGLAIFGLFKIFSGVIQRFQKKEEAAPPVAISTEEKLLSEIRDLLQAQVAEKKSDQ